jgi:aminoglycoside phosphotransferase (APT) family kinase protein
MRDLPSSAAAVQRAVRLAGPDATVRAVRALAGGTHARTFLIRTANPELEVILREFPPGDDAARHEAQVLVALDGLGGLAPRLLASGTGTGTGPDGAAPGVPWVLISRLPGTADIIPGQPSAWAAQLGTALAQIHATPGRRLAGLESVFRRPSGSAAAISGPAASMVAASWKLLAGPPAVLTHGDFWSGNVVWRGGVLAGVVDWSGGATGPPGYDIGWCRLDLYLLYGERIADEFLASYRAASPPARLDLLLWDLWAVARSHEIVETWVPNYRDLGRGDLTAGELRSRHTAWTQTVRHRAAGLMGTGGSVAPSS